MKKLYLFLVALFACTAIASAADWDIVLNVTEGANLVEAKVGSAFASATPVALKDGQNTISVPNDQYLYVDPKDPSYKVTFTDANNKSVNKVLWGGNYYNLYVNGEPTNPYTLTVVDPATAGIELIINVTGADRIDAVVGPSLSYSDTFDSESMEKITLIEGENKISRPEGKVLYINPKHEDDIFKILDKSGFTGAFRGYISNWYEINFNNYYAADCPYDITCLDETSYRSKSVTIIMDDYSKVKITRVGDAKVFEPTEETITIPYNADAESKFRVQPKSNSYTFYKVMFGDDEIKKKSGASYYEVDLADAAEDATIDVQTKFPEDLKFKTTITVEGPKEIISYIEINNETFEDIDAYISEDGFEVDPNSDIYIGINDNYKLEEIDDNGTIKTSVYSYHAIENIDCDHNVVIKGREFKTFNITFNVTGVEGITFELEDQETPLDEGENTVKMIEGKTNCRIAQNEGWNLLSVTDQDGREYINPNDWYWTNSHYITFYATEGYEYKIVAKKLEERKVTVTMDDCSLVTIGVNGKEIKPEENTIEVSYIVKPDVKLSIQPRSYDGGIYQVTADGKNIDRSSSWFYVNLVDNSGSEPVYVQNINVTAKFPEGLKYKTTISLDGPQEMIKYIKLDDVEVENIAAYLTEDGFESAPLTKIAIGIDEKLYDITELSDNGDRKYSYSQLTIDGILCDHNVVIKGTLMPVFDVKFNITGAEGLSCKFGGKDIELHDGENTIKATKKNNTVTIKGIDGWEIESCKDSNDEDYLEDYWFKTSGELDVKEGVEYTVIAKKIERNNQIVVYVEDYKAKDISLSSYAVCGFEKYQALTGDEITAGYHTLNFREEDGYFDLTLSAYPSYDDLIVYKNDETLAPKWEGAKFREDNNVSNGDVYKVFFDNDPGTHNVTFDVEDGVLDGYEVKKDVIADVADFSEAVKAVGPTKFTIAPAAVSRAAAEGFTVKVGEEEIAAVDGVYTFETTADTKVEIKANAPKTFDVIINVTCAEGIVAEYDGETLELKDGINTLPEILPDSELIFNLVDKEQYKWVSFVDNAGNDYLDYYGTTRGTIKAYPNEDENELTIVIKKIQRENKLVLFYDEFTNPDSAFGPKFSKYTIPNEIKPGYNVVEFADEDGGLSVNLIGAGTVHPYKNDEKTALQPLTSLYKDDAVADGNVYKFFFNTDPGTHTVTFDVEDGILDGYEVKKDILSDVNTAAPVKAVGYTEFTIAPVSRAAAEGFKVRVGGTEITPEDGVYTFKTTADTKVEVKSKLTGIEDILMNTNGPVDVFTLQGIRVLRDATADDIKALTPGFYIINGTKVLIK